MIEPTETNMRLSSPTSRRKPRVSCRVAGVRRRIVVTSTVAMLRERGMRAERYVLQVGQQAFAVGRGPAGLEARVRLARIVRLVLGGGIVSRRDVVERVAAPA